MSAVNAVLSRLMVEEGFRGTIYTDTKGKRTIGYGCNLDAGWSKELAQTVLVFQAQDVANALQAYPWYASLDEARQSVLLDLGFNNGINGLLHFPKMLAAIGAGDWQAAHDELLDSDAARELPTRYGPLAKILLTGVT